MKLHTFREGAIFSALLIAASAALCVPPAAAEITLGQLDDFQDGTTLDWRIGQPGYSVPANVANQGPQGFGDRALHSRSGPGYPANLVVLNEPNEQFPGPGNWSGNWTAAGVTQIALDVRNPGTLPDAGALAIRLGISGPDGTGPSGDVYVTPAVTVPPDGIWYSFFFDVKPADWIAVGVGTDINAALADVHQLRILNSRFDQFNAVSEAAEMYLDNIHALGPLPGDYNGNGEVDAADYVVWRKLDGQSGAGLAADGTGPSGTPDGVVNSLDYDFWRARFGNSNSGGGHHHGAGASVATAPEPATALHFGAGLVAVLTVYRRTRRGQFGACFCGAGADRI